ncbi:MAG: pyridoxal phosphate-dependent aminotransferase, partial [Alphaproteobacteria bacterium]
MNGNSKNRFSPLVDRIHGEGAEAWDQHWIAEQAFNRGEDVILLSVGDPNFDTPEPVIEATVQALRDGDTHYADIPGRAAVREAIAVYANKLARADVYKAENTILLAGAQCSLYAAIQCLLTEGDEVLAVDPLYVTYEAAIGCTGASLLRVPADEASGFRPDFDLIEKNISPKTKVLIFTSPNNPTGVALTEDEAKRL